MRWWRGSLTRSIKEPWGTPDIAVTDNDLRLVLTLNQYKRRLWVDYVIDDSVSVGQRTVVDFLILALRDI